MNTQASEPRFESIPLELLRESPVNPRKRFDEKKLEELAASIRQKGVLVPLIARPIAANGKPGGFELAAGHRRLRAAKAAGLAQVPVIVRELDDAAFLEVLTIENLQREDVHPLEEAEGFERLLKLKGYNVQFLAEKIGRDESYIYKRLALAKLIPAAKQAFLDGHIQIGHAVQLAALEPKVQEEAMKELFQEEVEGWGKDRRVIAKVTQSPSWLRAWIITEVQLDLAQAGFAKDDAKLLPKAGACVTCTKRTGANLALFDDTQKGDHCLDRACFHQKQNAHLTQIQKAAAKEGRKLVKLTRHYGAKDAVYEGNVKKLKPTEFCDAKEEAIYIDGPLVGKTVFICRDAKCSKHANRSTSSYERPEKTFAEVWADKKKRLEERIESETEAEVWRQVVAGVPEEFERYHMVLVGERLIERANHDARRVLCGVLGLEGEKGQHSTDFAAPLKAHLGNLSDRYIPGFLVGLTLLTYSGLDASELSLLAEEMEIDAAAIKKGIAEPLRAEFAAKKAKAEAAHKKKQAEAKKAAAATSKAAKAPKRDAKKAAANDVDE